MPTETGVNLRKKDPSTKMLRSGFGSQVKSASSSEPSWRFGTSVRDVALKVRGGAEGARREQNCCRLSPGSRAGSRVGARPRAPA